MSIAQAISILKASKSLASLLLSMYIPKSLYPHEAEVLIEFQKVVDAGLSQEEWLYTLAGLDKFEHDALLERLAYHHARGEDNAGLLSAC
jgi:hypothetical protein